MAKTKTALPAEAKLDYTTIDGVPTIRIEVSLTTRAQVNEVGEQLVKLRELLPEAKTRRVKAKAKTNARAKANGNKEEELFGKPHE